MADIVYDIEVYPNVFTLTAEYVDAPFVWCFEISDYQDDRSAILEWMLNLRQQGDRMVGFNNLGFDYPVLHHLVQSHNATALSLYEKAQAIIDSQVFNRWAHIVRPADRLVPQLDLFKVHHFDNKAKSTSLKVLEFNMRSDSVEDLPFAVGTYLEVDQIEVLKHYNLHDVQQTKAFYQHTLPMIQFRDELTKKYNRDFTNHNDTKIGKDYFAMELEKHGVRVYDFGPSGRTPRQTLRPQIVLRDAILPWIQFQQPEFNRIKNWLQEQVITETKGVFKDLTATVNGFEFAFGTGGIHGSVENRRIESDDDCTIIDLDVASFYPNLGIKNRFYPEHLGEQFCGIYSELFQQRKQYPKKSAESAMLKLALNGVYGDSNNEYSPFFDPLYTMKITLNGQLLLCLLAENLMRIPGLEMIQANTDGVTVRLPRAHLDKLEQVTAWWQQVTGLTLEQVEYRRMFIRDVNNYLAEDVKGDIKRIGDYEWKRDWHQNHSALIVPKVVEQVLLHDAPIRKTLEQWPDIMDFMLRTKVPKSSQLLGESEGQSIQLPNTIRYFVAKNGVKLIKRMPPLKGKTEWRRIGIESGWRVHVCNHIRDAASGQIDFDYYCQEIEKLCLSLK